MGYGLAARLGYPTAELDQHPARSHRIVRRRRLPPRRLADLEPGDRVVDLGSGSGMDAFLAARAVGPTGEVIGVDMTDAQLRQGPRASPSATASTNARFEKGHIEAVPVPDGSATVVISNGVINLCSDKTAVFHEIARILEPGGRMAISDIVTEHQLTEAIVCDVNLWASCIGGAMQQDDYRAAIEAAGLDDRDRPGEPGVRVHLRLGPGRHRDLRRQEHHHPRPQAGLNLTTTKEQRHGERRQGHHRPDPR